MKFWEVLKALEEGKTVKHATGKRSYRLGTTDWNEKRILISSYEEEGWWTDYNLVVGNHELIGTDLIDWSIVE